MHIRLVGQVPHQGLVSIITFVSWGEFQLGNKFLIGQAEICDPVASSSTLGRYGRYLNAKVCKL